MVCPEKNRNAGLAFQHDSLSLRRRYWPFSRRARQRCDAPVPPAERLSHGPPDFRLSHVTDEHEDQAGRTVVCLMKRLDLRQRRRARRLQQLLDGQGMIRMASRIQTHD